MNLIGLMLARNEEWIIGASARAAMQWCDSLIVYAHDCTDRTADLAYIAGGTVYAVGDRSGVWNEMDLRQEMLGIGREKGGTHFAIVDADEILTDNLSSSIREYIGALDPGELLDLPMIPAWRAIDMQRVDSCVWTRSWLTTAFRDRPDLGWAARDGYHFHARPPRNSIRGSHTRPVTGRSVGGVIHAQWADWPRLVAKQTLYKMIERLRWPDRESAARVNAKYDEAMDETGLLIEQIPSRWIHPRLMSFVDTGIKPWQESEIQRLIDAHGLDVFNGIDLKHFARQV